MTQKVLSERRLRVLRELSAQAAEAKTAVGACAEAMRVLQQDPHDVPFALAYLLDNEGTRLTLASTVGLPEAHAAAPASLDLSSADGMWPLAQAERQAVEVDLSAHQPAVGSLPGGPWPEASKRALVQPLLRSGETRPYGFLIAGTSAMKACGGAAFSGRLLTGLSLK